MTMQQAADTAVRTFVVVEASQQRAFDVYTQEMARWWPKEHHLLQAELKETVFEPRAGGRIYDVGVDGSECQWSRVLAYDPPERLVFSWDISLDWKVETDPERTSEVEIRFIPEGPDRTRVELEHRNLERHGVGWEGMRDAVGSADGWGLGMGRFARYASGQPLED
jgi:uncharacterized protein YndB with AHSA1/START domain